MSVMDSIVVNDFEVSFTKDGIDLLIDVSSGENVGFDAKANIEMEELPLDAIRGALNKAMTNSGKTNTN